MHAYIHTFRATVVAEQRGAEEEANDVGQAPETGSGQSYQKLLTLGLGTALMSGLASGSCDRRADWRMTFSCLRKDFQGEYPRQSVHLGAVQPGILGLEVSALRS